MTPEDVEALRTPGAADLLDRATRAMAEGVPDALALAERFRSEGYDPHLVGLALTQGRLRRKAAERLGPRGARLLWTPTRRSRPPVRRSPPIERLASAASARVADLGCGAGSDTLAFADAGLCTSWPSSRTRATAEVARANVETEGYADLVDVRVGDVTALDFATLGCDGGVRRPGPEVRRQPSVRRRGLVAPVVVGRAAGGARTGHRRQGRPRHPPRPAPTRGRG